MKKSLQYQNSKRINICKWISFAILTFVIVKTMDPEMSGWIQSTMQQNTITLCRHDPSSKVARFLLLAFFDPEQCYKCNLGRTVAQHCIKFIGAPCVQNGLILQKPEMSKWTHVH